jgi:mycothiol system anti-sigma-R factor
MSPCDECGFNTLRYLDKELSGQELYDFRAHLESCASCRASVEAEQALSHVLYRSRPLYSAPDALRARVAAAVERHAARSRVGFYERVLRVLGSGLADPTPRVARLRLLAASLAVVAMLLVLVPNFVRHARAANYVETAVAMHRGYLDGSLPLELHSNSPEQVTAWFTGKVPFSFRLPRAQITSGIQPAYQLTGAILVKYRARSAALVTYQKQNQRISLLVASADSAVVAGGEEVRSGELTFHYRTDEGFNVVTWNNHGLSYALVSSVSGSARASCLVCHQSMADSSSFRVHQ